VIVKTIQDVHNKNQKLPNTETAHPSIFDLLRKKVQDIELKAQNNQVQKSRRKPKSILDMLKDGIEGARKENKTDKKLSRLHNVRPSAVSKKSYKIIKLRWVAYRTKLWLKFKPSIGAMLKISISNMLRRSMI
jgi:hypothetical protein